VEAGELFRIIDLDGSNNVSLDEFRNALRDAAPAVGLEGFWQRFNAEWPEVATLLHESCVTREHEAATKSRHRAGALLAEMLPPDMRERCIVPQSPASERKQQRQQLEQVLHSLNAESFDVLAARLDIARNNAAELLKHLVNAAATLHPRVALALPGSSVQSQDQGGQAEAAEVYLDDFAELLELWTANDPTSPAHRKAHRIVAPAQIVVAALKAELAPTSSSVEVAEESRARRSNSRRIGRRPRRPLLPWCPTAATPRALARVY